jgi:hypothetical protein
LSTCTACAAGSYQPHTGQDTCLTCPPGKSQGATGQPSCTDCVSGSFSASNGASVCSNCDSIGSGFTSSQGSANCSLCLSGFYLDPIEFTCRECESNILCPTFSGNALPTPKADYWMDTHALKSFAGASVDIYRCPRLTCKGSTPEHSACWLPDNITTCNRDELLCTNGATGPLCGLELFLLTFLLSFSFFFNLKINSTFIADFLQRYLL